MIGLLAIAVTLQHQSNVFTCCGWDCFWVRSDVPVKRLTEQNFLVSFLM